MIGPSKGVAHVSFHGGSLCLPARSPYDRQVLAEEVRRESHMHQTVQILLDDHRWLVQQLGRSRRVACARCGRTTGCACHSGTADNVMLCLDCALG